MQLNLFSVPVFIGNINSKKLKFTNQKTQSSFASDVKTSIETGEKNLKEESAQYLVDCIVKLLEEKFKSPFRITLRNIWQNIYKKSDFQEKHIHIGSHFSFIIYDKIDVPKTLFFNPAYYLIESFYKESDGFKQGDICDTNFMPPCREGQIIVFPSFLEHMVRKTSNAVTISGNINFKFI